MRACRVIRYCVCACEIFKKYVFKSMPCARARASVCVRNCVHMWSVGVSVKCPMCNVPRTSAVLIIINGVSAHVCACMCVDVRVCLRLCCVCACVCTYVCVFLCTCECDCAR